LAEPDMLVFWRINGARGSATHETFCASRGGREGGAEVPAMECADIMRAKNSEAHAKALC
jgi:hypothetical protein